MLVLFECYIPGTHILTTDPTTINHGVRDYMDIDINVVLGSTAGALLLCVCCACCLIKIGQQRAEAHRERVRQQFLAAAAPAATADLTVSESGRRVSI